MSQWKIIKDVNLYFVTTTIIEWENVFVSIPMFEVMIESLKYCVSHKGLHLHGYVIMPNHAHYIVSSDPPERISDIMRDYNRFTSGQITSELEKGNGARALKIFREAAEVERRGNSYKVWQDGFHPIAVGTAGFLQEKLNYIHANPVRKGFVEMQEHWKYSSARNYISDDHSVIHVECLQ